MITIRDCEAFCDADPGWVRELACRECLGMVQAYARAHEVSTCASLFNMSAAQHSVNPTSPRYSNSAA